MPSPAFSNKKFDKKDINEVGKLWLSGIGVKDTKIKDFEKICTDYFGYTFSWFLGAIATRMKEEENQEYTEYSNLYEELALCCELGLPTLLSGKIYLAGINSRTAAREISIIIDNFNQNKEEENSPFSILSLLELNIDSESRISQIKDYITLKFDKILKHTQNPITIKWLEIFQKTQNEIRSSKKYTNPIKPIELDSIDINYDRLFMRRRDSNVFLCSSDYKFKLNIDSGHWNDINENKFFFKFENGEWLTVINS